MSTEANTEDRIMEAARRIFTSQGLDGARMQDIADEARINKAMLHYYFRSKKKLFEIIFEEQLIKLLSGFHSILHSEKDLKQKLKEIINHEFRIIMQYPELPLFILYEANRDPKLIERKLEGKSVKQLTNLFEKSIMQAIENSEIRRVDPKHLLINIMSLCIYPFVAKPMIKAVLEYTDSDFENFIEHRPALLAGLIWKSLSLK